MGPADTQCQWEQSQNDIKSAEASSKQHPSSQNATSLRVSYRPATSTESGGAQGVHVPAHPADLTLATPPVIAPSAMSNHPAGPQRLSAGQEGHWHEPGRMS